MDAAVTLVPIPEDSVLPASAMAVPAETKVPAVAQPAFEQATPVGPSRRRICCRNLVLYRLPSVVTFALVGGILLGEMMKASSTTDYESARRNLIIVGVVCSVGLVGLEILQVGRYLKKALTSFCAARSTIVQPVRV